MDKRQVRVYFLSEIKLSFFPKPVHSGHFRCLGLCLKRRLFSFVFRLFDTLKKITEYDPPKLNRRAAVSNDLSKFAGRCLRKDPRERPRYESLKKSPFFANFDESSDRKRLTKYCKQFENLCG